MSAVRIRHAEVGDEAFWFRLDRHLPEAEFYRKVRDRMGYLLLEDEVPVGLLRYNLFWDQIPFCTMLFVERSGRGKGFGTALMARWEEDMRNGGHHLAMVSTQADETAQHFYRKLGYRDAGGLLLQVPGFEQPVELFLVKALS